MNYVYKDLRTGWKKEEILKTKVRVLDAFIYAISFFLYGSQVFPILAKPTPVTCALGRLMPGISFAMMYASLFTKTNRIARILAGSKKRFPKRKPMFMSATAQVSNNKVLFLRDLTTVTA